MILGIGTDIVETARIAATLKSHGERFITRAFAPDERVYAPDHPRAPAHYAKRFAAKEAMSKAMRTGIRDGITLRDMYVVNDANGAPQMIVAGQAAQKLAQMAEGDPPHIHLSLSDERGYALAFVVIDI